MEKTEKEVKKIYIVPFRSYPTGYRKFEKNNKKTQKSKKYHYGIISSKNWKRLRMRENKNYISVTFLPDGLEKIPKK